ncbi:MAG: hypothetical protein WA280_18655 [Xanthobacteraceae bacterium]
MQETVGQRICRRVRRRELEPPRYMIQGTHDAKLDMLNRGLARFALCGHSVGQHGKQSANIAFVISAIWRRRFMRC